MVAYSVLFMLRTPNTRKPQTKKMPVFEQDDTPKSKALKAKPSSMNTSPMPNAARSTANSSNPDIAKQITMIRSHAADKNLQGAFSVFEAMEQSGIDLNCIMFNTVLDACVECKDLKAAEAWMERMRQSSMTDVVSFNTLIKAHLQNGSFDKVRRLMEMMTSEGLQPNQVTFNEILNSIASKGGDGRRKQMWGIVDEMKLAGVKPNQVTISILLKCLNSYSSQTDIATTMDLIKSMDDPMDEVLLSSVVEACVRIGQPELLEKQLKHLRDSTPVTINGSHTYGSLIKAYGHAKDLTSIWRCWKEMRSRHITPTSITMGCMIEAIVNNGDTEGAYDLIHQMQEDDQCRDVLNSVIYCSVLKGFTRERKIDRVWAVYKEMKEKRAELSVVTYSTMLKGHCQNGDVQSGFRILDQIKKDPHLKPD